jgi:hypothetical protein
MRMSKSIFAAAFAVMALAASCTPPPDVPPPRFRPNPPYPPEVVDPYAQPADDTYQETAPPPAPTRPGEYPTARRGARPNEVISPYEPFNVIDVEGFGSGQLARDPSNNKIFRVP